MTKVRVILVGLGARARIWRRVVSAHPACRIVGLVDTRSEAVAAALAIFPLLIAEVLAAFARRPSQIFAGVCALLVVVGLALSPVFGFGTGERIAIGAHVAWLLSIRVAHRSATSSTA